MKRTNGWRLSKNSLQKNANNNNGKGRKGRRGRNGLGNVNVLEERRLLAATVLSTQGTSTTTGGNGNSTFLGMSEDGRYALYQTAATDVNASVTDTNGQTDLYLVDRVTGSETLVSRSSGSATTTANGGVTTAFISADGNFVAYESSSTNAVANQSNQLLTTSNVFLFNRQTGTTTLVSGSYGSASVSGNGSATLSDLKNPLSVDGKYLIYQTRATDVQSGITDINLARDIYRYNRTTGLSELVSRSETNPTWTEALQGVSTASASDDGTRVIFNRETLFGSPLFAWNGADNSLRLVDAKAMTTTHWISGDGKWIAYVVNGTSQNGLYLTSFTGDYSRRLSYIWDVKGVTTSYDGRYVSFVTQGSVGIPGATFAPDYTYDAFVFDRLADADGEAYLVSHVNGNDLVGVGGAQEAYITPSGRYVFWASDKTNLVGGTFAGNTNVYRYDVLTKKNVLISSQSGTTSTGANGQSLISTLSRGLRSDLTGETIGFNSSASNLTSPGDLDTNTMDAVIASNALGDKVGTWSNGRFLVDVNDNRSRDVWRDVSGAFGTTADLPISGNWSNADGLSHDEIGTFKNGTWSLDYNSNSIWDGASGGDLVVTFGQAGDLPIIGDWNGDGKDEIGVFRNGAWMYDTNGNFQWDGTSGGDTQLNFGIAGDLPVVGDWNGDGIDEIGVVRNGIWYLDLNGNRVWDSGIDGSFSFGNSTGDTPVVGDWDRDGKDDIGVFRNGAWYLDMNGNRGWNTGSDVTFTFGNGSDAPLVGKWKNLRIGQTVPKSNLADDIGKWNSAVFVRDADNNRLMGTAGDTSNEFGVSTDTGIVGDWDGDGFDEIGAYRNAAASLWYLDHNGSLNYNSGDLQKSFGTSGDTPIVGNWNGGGKDEIGVFRISNGSAVWYFDASGNFQWDTAAGGDIQAVYGVDGDLPVVGDWTGDGKDRIGIFRIVGGQGAWYLDANGNRNWDGVSGGDIYAVFGQAGDTPVVGDWNGDGKDDIGTFNAGLWSLDQNGNFAWNGANGGDVQFTYGASGDKPLVGNWKGIGAMASMTPPSVGATPASTTVTSNQLAAPGTRSGSVTGPTAGVKGSTLASLVSPVKKKSTSSNPPAALTDAVFSMGGLLA